MNKHVGEKRRIRRDGGVHTKAAMVQQREGRDDEEEDSEDSDEVKALQVCRSSGLFF